MKTSTEDNFETILKYRNHTKQKISDMLLALTRIKTGDLSHIKTLASSDEFFKLYNEINMFLDTISSNMADFKELNAALKREVTLRDRFLVILAHELRNPLAPISNTLELIKIRGLKDKALAQDVNIIERQFKKIEQLLKNLADSYRIVHNKITLGLASVDLNTVIKQAVETSQPLLEAGKHKLEITLAKKPVCLIADPIRLEQIFVNILNNAAKYTPNKGHIKVTVSKNKSFARVSIEDNGIGIAKEMLGSVFDIFQQGDQSKARQKGGLGIGLMLVKQLVELHKGKINVYSQGINKGSKFVITLPLEGSGTIVKDDSIDKYSEVKKISSKNNKILVVDDNKDSADSLAKLLEKIGNETQVAYDGKTALKTASEFRPSIVILDIEMPKMDGYQVAVELRKNKDLARSKIIALTGYDREEDRLNAKKSGFDHHFAKPIDFKDLQSIL